MRKASEQGDFGIVEPAVRELDRGHLRSRLVDYKTQVKALMGRSALGRAYLEERKRAMRPPWWDRNQQDERAIAVVITTVLGRSSNAIDIGANAGTILRRIQQQRARWSPHRL